VRDEPIRASGEHAKPRHDGEVSENRVS